ncbi:peptidase T [Phascolarctobacterium sp.]|uniref:peptidase T n=1 Tax=Phascolarctobacterium sp. TaxID=2049039 RepID=UPI00386F540F
MKSMQERLTERFLRYAAVSSQSVEGSAVVPSTPGQWELAKLLKEDLAALGVVDLEISEYCVLTGRLPGNLPAGYHKVPTVGWVAHLDTVNVNLSPDVHPQIVKNYQGGDVLLNAEKQIYIKVSEHPELEKYIGSDLITSDGTSVLGADNKAAIANLLVALETLHEDASILHGDIYVCFVPDEEVGLCGSKKMDFSKFPVDFAYTIDCCELGEVVYQTFNAGSATIKVQGVTAHPMSAKNTLVNPTLVAVDVINCLDRMQTPEHTEGTEGFIWVESMQTNVSEATLNLKIRDHSKPMYEARKKFIADAVEYVKAKNPKAKVEMQIVDVYGNIADAINDENRVCVDHIFEAMSELGITPKDIAMRGGTDGSFISTKGIPTPNYFTGAHNFHSYCEFMPMDAVEKSCQMTLKLIELITK